MTTLDNIKSSNEKVELYIDEKMLGKILRKVPQENAFYFYTKNDQPLGVSSNSLIDFCEKIGSIDIKSIEFHEARGDIERWIKNLGDIELAERLKLVKEANLTGETLREKLYAVLKSRYDELLGVKGRVLSEEKKKVNKTTEETEEEVGKEEMSEVKIKVKRTAKGTGEEVGNGIRKSAKAVYDFGKGMKKGLKKEESTATL